MEITHKNQGELDSTMLPFVMRELVELVMKKKALPLGDALYYIYSSKLYKSLLDKSTKLWYSSTLSLYETLEKEKTEEKMKELLQVPQNSNIFVMLAVGYPASNVIRTKSRKELNAIHCFNQYNA